ncbi:MAG: sulfotransferase [Actinomycetota bacterium]
MISSQPYVFIVGMNKTATTSLHHFFQDHGWQSVHYDGGRLARTMLRNALRGQRVLKGYDHRFRVCADMVVNTRDLRFEANPLFPALDRDYPGAYFILNTRDEDAWVASRLANYSKGTKMNFVDLECRVSGLKSADEASAKWRTDRREFESRVERYFEGSQRFLKLDIDRDDVPQALSHFLAVEFDPNKWTQIKTNTHRAPAHSGR